MLIYVSKKSIFFIIQKLYFLIVKGFLICAIKKIIIKKQILNQKIKGNKQYIYYH